MQGADHADAASTVERLYRADEAAVFGLDRVAPLPTRGGRAPSWSVISHAPPHPAPASAQAADAAELEDLTESLTPDECDAAAAAFSAVPEDFSAAGASSDRVTTQVRLPPVLAVPPVLPVPPGPAAPTVTLMTPPPTTTPPPPGPLLSPARDSAESAPGPAPGPAARAVLPGVVRWGVFGAAVGVGLGVALLLGRGRPAEERPSQRPLQAVQPVARTTEPTSGPDAFADALLEQAAVALREHHYEQALALLSRYQVSASDHAVEILIRALKKDLQKELPPAGSRSP